jgi:predicted nucleic acid-binding protein
VAGLVDTNVLVYRFDGRFAEKQARAIEFLRRGVEEDTVALPHQAVLEFVAVAGRESPRGPRLLSPDRLVHEAESLMSTFRVLYPTRAVVLTALRIAKAYGLAWYDAHLCAYAECFGLPELYSEDFEHGRTYGPVKIVNPFLA